MHLNQVNTLIFVFAKQSAINNTAYMYIFICFLFIQEVNDLYRAIIKMMDSGDKIRVDQSHLETVIPAQGMHIILVAICIQI